jgi:hypothetical protein
MKKKNTAGSIPRHKKNAARYYTVRVIVTIEEVQGGSGQGLDSATYVIKKVSTGKKIRHVKAVPCLSSLLVLHH